jgi:hypothetical protein
LWYVLFLNPSPSHQYPFSRISSSLLGMGIDLTKEETVCYRFPVIQPVATADINIKRLNDTKISSIMTHSCHANSYAIAGWFETGISAASSWSDGSVLPGGFTSTPNKDNRDLPEGIVSGRYSLSTCYISLHRQLQPDSTLSAAVYSALDEDTDEERCASLRKVFSEWGYFFVAGVIMGGVRYICSRRKEGAKESC